jgi:hypothetical protein
VISELQALQIDVMPQRPWLPARQKRDAALLPFPVR